MIIEKIRFGDFYYILKRTNVSRYINLCIYKMNINERVARGTEPKNIIKSKVSILAERKLWSGSSKKRTENYIEEMKDRLTFIILDEVDKMYVNGIIEKNNEEGE
ncbi:hypothetical protein ACSSUQ_004214 [Yersinia enterocolitica]